MGTMTSLLQIRNVPEDQRRALKARASARGESLNAYLLDVLSREVARPTVAGPTVSVKESWSMA